MMLFVVACSSSKEDKQDQISDQPVFPDSRHNLNAEQLAQAYCGSCHLFPEPELLSKEMWRKVLPEMGSRLGIKFKNYNPLKGLSMYDAYVIREANIYPKDTLISLTNWKKIEDFYMNRAPDQPLPQPKKNKVKVGLKHFKTNTINNLEALPLSTMIKIDSATGLIYWGSRGSDLIVTDNKGQVVKEVKLDSPPSYLELTPEDEMYVLTMGFMDPSENSDGALTYIKEDETSVILLSQLQRPVFATIADLNEDQLSDIVVSHYGNQTGKLSWFEATANGQYREHILKKVAGALKTEVYDFNKDGFLDIVALMGQGNEGLFIFYNQGDNIFIEDVVLQFSPVYGSSSFQLVDFNKDGHKDILYVNGDNADFSFSLKNYHGVRLFFNDGNNQFIRSYFYPLHGATKAIAKDFDLDGDMDIVAIAFFPDFENGLQESFVYLENIGNLNFEPYSFREAIDGRWLVMDVEDIDCDGDSDIVIGSFLHYVPTISQSISNEWLRKNYHMIFLENTMR